MELYTSKEINKIIRQSDLELREKNKKLAISRAHKRRERFEVVQGSMLTQDVTRLRALMFGTVVLFIGLCTFIAMNINYDLKLVIPIYLLTTICGSIAIVLVFLNMIDSYVDSRCDYIYNVLQKMPRH